MRSFDDSKTENRSIFQERCLFKLGRSFR